MKEFKTKKLLKYVIASVIGAVAAFAIAYYRSETAPAGNTLSFISDGLFVVGFFHRHVEFFSLF